MGRLSTRGNRELASLLFRLPLSMISGLCFPLHNPAISASNRTLLTEFGVCKGCVKVEDVWCKVLRNANVEKEIREPILASSRCLGTDRHLGFFRSPHVWCVHRVDPH